MVAPVSGVVVGAVAFSESDDEISRTWKLVEERVIQMAGGDRSKIKQGLRIENVLDYLDEAQAKDAKASAKYSTVKNIFNRTLQCIQTVGGIVADGASYVGGPKLQSDLNHHADSISGLCSFEYLFQRIDFRYSSLERI